jgi:hypothetical protein
VTAGTSTKRTGIVERPMVSRGSPLTRPPSSLGVHHTTRNARAEIGATPAFSGRPVTPSPAKRSGVVVAVMPKTRAIGTPRSVTTPLCLP